MLEEGKKGYNEKYSAKGINIKKEKYEKEKKKKDTKFK